MTKPTNTEKRPSAAPHPGPARLVALLAGLGLSLLGVLGFFYDAGFGTGSHLASDDLAGVLNVNGWRNVIYLVTGLMALALAPRFPRLTALGLGVFYVTFGLWGLAETDRGIGSILDALPLGNRDNALHLIVGGTALLGALVDGPFPSPPKRRKGRDGKSKQAASGAKAASGGRRRSPATPRAADGGGPR